MVDRRHLVRASIQSGFQISISVPLSVPSLISASSPIGRIGDELVVAPPEPSLRVGSPPHFTPIARAGPPMSSEGNIRNCGTKRKISANDGRGGLSNKMSSTGPGRGDRGWRWQGCLDPVVSSITSVVGIRSGTSAAGSPRGVFPPAPRVDQPKRPRTYSESIRSPSLRTIR
jgi:hypothetical protein